MVRAAVLALAMLVGTTPAALAQPLPQGGPTYEEIAEWLRGQGLDAEVRSEGAEKWVASGANGVSWDVNGYDCEADRCGAWQFSAAFVVDTLADGVVNRWNLERRYLKAFEAPYTDGEAALVPDGEAALVQYDVLLTPGMSWASLEEHLRLFAGTVPHFAEHIGYVASAPAAE